MHYSIFLYDRSPRPGYCAAQASTSGRFRSPQCSRKAVVAGRVTGYRDDEGKVVGLCRQHASASNVEVVADAAPAPVPAPAYTGPRFVVVSRRSGFYAVCPVDPETGRARKVDVLGTFEAAPCSAVYPVSNEEARAHAELFCSALNAREEARS